MVRLRTLGSVELHHDDGRELRAVLAQPKRLALLVYLAVAAPGKGHRRDTLLALFWPELDAAHARGSLSQALRFLRRELGAAVVAGRGADEVRVDPAALWCDAAAIRLHVGAARYADALALYRGDLLPGVHADWGAAFDAWLEHERVQLRALAARGARALAEARERDGSFTTAVSSARRAVELSDLDERALRELLALLDRLGDRAGAIHAYEAFARRLADAYGAEPAAETAALVERIRTRAGRAAPAGWAATAIPGPIPRIAALDGWQVERELGRGGMATVYLARDAKHDRHVALKVMRPDLPLPAGIERFLREIRITARLAHPHVLPLLDSGADGGVLYLVTPFVAGESLRERLRREGRLPLAEALRLAGEVAEALDYAHRSGVVHRDVKPENVLLADGHAVVADFGVARALAASGAGDAIPESDPGALVGSRAYMSPEVSGGAAGGVPSDVYALGCMLFEMLTGEPPGGGESPRARLGMAAVPDAVERLVADCLAPLPERRPASAAAVLYRLEALRSGGEDAPRGALARARARRRLATGGAALGTVAIASYAVPRLDASRLSIEVGSTTQVTNAPGVELDAALSPDGRLVAYAAGTPGRLRIHVRPLAGGRAIQVSGDGRRVHRWPSWSPDGRRIAYLAIDGDRGWDAPGRLEMVPAHGGPPRVVADTLPFFAGPAWSPDGRHLAYPGVGTIVVRGVDGGPADTIPAREDAHSLAWSPDGTRLAFVSGNPAFTFGTTGLGNLGPSAVWTVARDGGAPRRLGSGLHVVASPVWTPDGRGVLHVSNAGGAFDVHHQRVDAAGRPIGEPRRLTTGLDAHGIALSRDGARLAYSRMDFRSNVHAAPIDPGGGVTPASAIRAVTDENQSVETVDVSRDGAWLVFDSNRDGRSHLYRMPTAGGEPVQLTRGPSDDFAPAWSPDGRWIAFHSRAASRGGRRAVHVVGADGNALTRISTDTLDDSYPRWGPDGRSIVFGRRAVGAMVATLGADGRWGPPVRFRSPSTSGTVADAPVAGRWTSDGRRLVYHRRGTLHVQERAGPPRTLLTERRLGGPIAAIAVGPDPAIVYVRRIDALGVHTFHAVPLDGGAPRLLLRLDGSDRRPSRVIFSTDGRRLYFTLPEVESDVWTLALRRQ